MRFRHDGFATRIAYSPDGKLLASAGWDLLVRLWEADTGKELRRCVGHTGDIPALTFSPDGKSLASAGVDRTIRFWDPSTGKQIL